MGQSQLSQGCLFQELQNGAQASPEIPETSDDIVVRAKNDRVVDDSDR